MRRALTAAVLVLALAGCGTGAPAAPEAGMAVADCAGRDVMFPEAPERVVVLDGYAAQSMVRLGLGDRITAVGFTAPFSVEKGPIRAELARLPVLTAGSIPATELVAAQRPDLVITSAETFGGAPGSPKESDLATMNAKGLAACVPDGPLTSLRPAYDFLLRIGRVFRVEQRAEQLVAELQARERAVTAPAGPKPTVLILPDNPVAGQPVPTSSPSTIPSGVVTAAGGVNVFADVTGTRVQVSPEQIVERDPQVIVVVTDYSFVKLKGRALVDSIRANPLLAHTSAVRDGRVLSVSQFLTQFPSPLNVDALEQVAAGLRP
ncbi:ABC transporter substrate-binding protein [Actinoplanes sp. NPDC049265]|uniref:ABC transporter substrate-binding protein n=1 Tax=Actinoplanes sp. NPDC049265 TaxID=3363902 RepID=UPI00371C145A